MKKNLLFFLAFLWTISLSAQFGGGQGGGGGNWGGNTKTTIKGKITGQLIDEETKEPIEFATAILLDSDFGKEIQGVLTDEKGRFSLVDVVKGTYDVQLSIMGYEDKVIKKIKLSPEKPDEDLEVITIAEQAIQIEGAEVTAEASLIENRIDKIVFNAEKDATNVGGNAADVLRKVPLLSVDLEGNVTLRGSQNIRILLNGKTSGLFANSVADALKAIPAEQIKKVEVITTPTAKYDGEGSAGIVNIITKKKTVEGFSGSINSSIGTRQNNAGLSINAAKGRFGFNAGGYTFFSWPRDGTYNFYREDYLSDGSIRVLDQGGVYSNNIIGYSGNAGAFYDFNAYNSINMSLRANGFNNFRDGVTTVAFNDPLFNINQLFDRNTNGKTLNNGLDWTTDYKKTFKKPEQEFTLAFQLNTNLSDQDDEKQQALDDALLRQEQMNTNDGRNYEYTIQTDYVHPFSKKAKLEIGAKGVLRRINSDYSLQDYDFSLQQFVVNSLATDIFTYDQDVYAGYASMTFSLDKEDKWGAVAGARYENTAISGEFNSGDTAPFENSYDNILPSFILTRKLKGFSSIKLSYTKRIQRPSLFYVNPFTNNTDERNIVYGNPFLNPEITQKYEVNYNTFVKGVVFNASLYYNLTEDVIESFLTVDDAGVSQTSFQNIGTNNSYGFNFFTSFTLFKKWTIRGNVDVFTYDVSGNLNGESLSRQTMNWNGFLSSSYDFGKGLKAEAFGFYRSPRLTVQGSTPTFSMISFGASKELFDKRASLGISIIEPFQRDKSFPSTLEGPGFYQISDFTIPFRSFGIKFSYRFGKLDFKGGKRNSKIRNDDQKEGEGSQF